MELTFDAWITVGKEDYDYIQKRVIVDYNLTKEDLEEFVKEQGFSNSTDYFMEYIDEGSEKENKKYFNEFIKPYLEEKCYMLESEIDVTCKDEKSLENFLIEKYEDKFNDLLLKKIDEDFLTADLNYCLDYY